MGTRLGIAVGFLLLMVSGCSSTEYRGANPSARWFTGTPAPRDYYLGMDFQFAVDREPEYHHFDTPASIATAAAPEAAHAETTLAPASGN